MKLRELLIDLFNARPLHRATQGNYRRAVVYFENYVGREAVVSDLTNRSVNSWLAASETEYPGSYVASLRRDLLVVWNFAADCGLCQHPKGRLIRRPTVDRKPASAWPNWWIPRLIEACQELPGNVRKFGVPRAWFMEAYLRVQSEILCRPADMRLLQWSNLEPDGTIVWTQHKTGKPNSATISRDTLSSVNRLRGMHPIVIFPLGKNSIELMVFKVFEAARIEKPKGESFGHLRHTGGTAIARSLGNDAARTALGHTPASKVFEQFYLDRTKIPRRQNLQWWTE